MENREELWLEGGAVRLVYTDEYVEQLQRERDTAIASRKALAKSGMIEAAKWNAQLAASQAREQQLREALIGLYRLDEIEHQRHSGDGDVCSEVQLAREAIATPSDTTSLEALIIKAGEVMRERCCGDLQHRLGNHYSRGNCEAIRALPGVTLEDLK